MKESFLKPKYLLLISLVLILVVTNPTKEQYYKWVKSEIKEAQTVVVVQVLGFEQTEYPKTRIIDWKIFSTYETYFDGNDKIFIGIGGNFFMIHSTKVLP